MSERIENKDEMMIALFCAISLIGKIMKEGDGSGYNIPEEYKTDYSFYNLVSVQVSTEMSNPQNWGGA